MLDDLQFYILPTAFQSYRDVERGIMKGCVQWNPVFGLKDLHFIVSPVGFVDPKNSPVFSDREKFYDIFLYFREKFYPKIWISGPGC